MISAKLTPSLASLVLRVTSGILLIVFHARGKIFNFAEEAVYFPDPFGLGHRGSLVLALVTELVGSLLLVVGLATRAAGLALAATMGTVVLVAARGDAHADHQLALVYAVPFLGAVILGGGDYSLDRVVERRWLDRA